MHAAREGNMAIVRILLESGADINAEGGEYGRPLQSAANWGRVRVAQLLLERGADVNAKEGRYGFALNAAANVHITPEQESCTEIARLLADFGASINAKCGAYGSALCTAWAFRKKHMARWLLENGP